MRGRGGGTISQANLRHADALDRYLATDKITGAKRQQILADAKAIAVAVSELKMTGDPSADWLARIMHQGGFEGWRV
jgi:hypothetical protein